MTSFGVFGEALVSFNPAAPGCAVLQAGRELTVRTRLASGVGQCAVDSVVKCYPRRTSARRFFDALGRRLPKAQRSFELATELLRRVPGSTPQPLGAVVMDDGSGFFATRTVDGLKSFTRVLCDIYASGGPCEVLIGILERVAAACRTWHDAGFFHGDLGNQNIQFAPDGSILTLDLDRARFFGCQGGVPVKMRARDLSRIALPSDFLRVFFEMYWRRVPPKEFLDAQRRFRKRFAIHTATRKWRHPLRKRHRAAEPVYPKAPDIWIWDRKSEQAVSTLVSRDRRKWQSFSRVALPVFALLRSWPKVMWSCRRLGKESFSRPVPDVRSRFFISVSADRGRWDRERRFLSSLGPGGVHVRLYFHESSSETDFKLGAISELSSAGFDVAVSLVQSRTAVLAPDAWRRFCERALSVLPSDGSVRWVEYLHAPNRVKWGIWNYSELKSLLEMLPDFKAMRPDISFAAPPVIDFEWDWLAGALLLMPKSAFAVPSEVVVAAELYLDRRGAPENKQGAFDGVGKLCLFRALSSRNPVIVTEFNWPIAGTAEWSPVGSPWVSPGVRHGDPSVCELDAAVFAVRWFLLGICSGHASSMCFWALAAHGFGLVDPGVKPDAEWRERPAFTALKELFAFLDGCRFVEAPLKGGASGAWLLLFRKTDEAPRAIAWKVADVASAPFRTDALGFAPTVATDVFGKSVEVDAALSAIPVFYR